MKHSNPVAVNVVGGGGFIGSRLCKRLSANEAFSPTIIDKVISKAFPSISAIGDVRSLDSLREHLSDGSVLINLAAEHRDDVRPIKLYDDVNVTGAENLCRVAREKNITTIIFTSTVAVYGFAPIGTDESGKIAPFNDYGRTKYEAEKIFRVWQSEDPDKRCLVIIRPTVVFGERNRGNVYNLLRQIASNHFVMIGPGLNRKSMAYVENVAALLEFCISFKPGIHTYNYIDKPDFTMNSLVSKVNLTLGKSEKIGIRIPYAAGYLIGKAFDLLALLTRRRMTISSIRVKKFCSDSVFNTSIQRTGFLPPVSLNEALERTVRHEFLESHGNENVFFTE